MKRINYVNSFWFDFFLIIACGGAGAARRRIPVASWNSIAETSCRCDFASCQGIKGLFQVCLRKSFGWQAIERLIVKGRGVEPYIFL